MDKLHLLSYVKHYRFNSIFIKNFLMIILLVLLPVTIISGYIYDNNSRMLEYEVRTISMRSLHQAMEVINSLLKGTDRMAVDIAINTNTEMFIKSHQYNLIRENFYEDITSLIKSFANSNEVIDTIYVYSEKNSFILSSRNSAAVAAFEDITWLDWYDKAQVADHAFIAARKKEEVYPYLISVMRPVYREEKAGAVLVNINMEKLGNMIYGKDKQRRDNIFILDKNNRVIFNKDMTLSSKSIEEISLFSGLTDMAEDYSVINEIDGEEYIITLIKSPYLGLKYVSFVPVNDFNERAGSMQKFLMQIILIGLVLSLAISLFISIKSYRPFENIIFLMESADDSLIMHHPTNVKGKTEGNEIKYIMNNITRSINTTREQQAELKKRMEMLNHAQVSALIAQINPHFVYNTLETINIKAIRMSGYDNEVSQMVTSLADLLRLSLESNTHFSTVAREKEHVMLYIRIMEKRYEGRFTVVWDIDEDVVDYRVVKICLQPIVENAIEHGIKPVKRHGNIRIKGRKSEGEIRLEVSDNGVGMSRETLEKVRAGINEIYVMKGHHVGLANVNQRIKIIFGDPYGITVESEENEGTRIIIVHPCLKNEY